MTLVKRLFTSCLCSLICQFVFLGWYAEAGENRQVVEKEIAFYATVSSVTDGDSLIVKRDGTVLRIRLWGVDAPEYDQPGGRQSKRYMRQLLKDRHIIVVPKTVDKYGRIVAIVKNKKGIVNEMLIASGNGWVHKYFCKNTVCDRWFDLERKARDSGIGLWHNRKPVEPWVWKSRKQGTWSMW